MTYHIGQIVPSTIKPKLCRGGHPEWYALIVPPQGEAKAKAFLKRHNIHSFFIVEKRSRIDRRTKKKVTYERPMVPGYLFVKMPARPIWGRVFHRKIIIGVLGRDRPLPLRPMDMKEMQGMRDTAAENLKARKNALNLAKGDEVQIEEGPLKSFVLDVDSIKGDNARLKFKAGSFAGKDVIEVSLSSLKKI